MLCRQECSVSCKNIAVPFSPTTSLDDGTIFTEWKNENVVQLHMVIKLK